MNNCITFINGVKEKTMAKNKNTFGKLVAFTTAIAAIGGTCYVFRDKIKAHPLYEKSKDKFGDLYSKITDRFADDDFDDTFFDDDEVEQTFNAERGREYTSITINAKNETIDDTNDIPEDDEEAENTETADDTEEESLEDTLEDSIPIISFDKARNDKQSASAYENEGLSDVSEDPDTLAEQDQLDF